MEKEIQFPFSILFYLLAHTQRYYYKNFKCAWNESFFIS